MKKNVSMVVLLVASVCLLIVTLVSFGGSWLQYVVIVCCVIAIICSLLELFRKRKK